MVRLFFFLWLIVLIPGACKDETRDNPPIKGNYFFRANPWKFYFVNGAGEDVLSLQPGKELPTTELEFLQPFQQARVPADYDGIDNYYQYNGNHNSVIYDAGRGLCYWMTTVPGNEYVTESEFYVHFSRRDIDTVKVRFKFTYEGVLGAPMVADIVELFYNEVLVIKNDDYISGDGIFIRK